VSTDQERLALLANVSRVLSGSLDYEATLASIARLATPELGAWSIVDLCEPGSRMRRVAVVHPDPAKQPVARALQEGWPPERGDPLGAPAVVETRKSIVIPHVTDAMLVACARGPENLRLLRSLGIGSLMTVPMVVRDCVLGAMTFVTPTTGHQYTAVDLAFAEDLGARAALALDSARLYRAAVGQKATEAALADAERARADAEGARGEAEIARLTAEAANRAKAEFVANMSHELRTPLNAIGGYADLLILGVRGKLTQRQREDVERIKRSQRHLLALVNDVLNFARIEIGVIGFDIVDVTVGQILDDATELVGAHIATKGFKFERRCPADLTAHTDAEKAQQVVLNILSNAIKFTPPGGSITIDCAAGPHDVAIRISDTGPGIPADKIDAIFEPFVRLDSSLTRTTEGTGLGLAISRDLARAMGGDLVVESAAGHGSTFHFTLPVPDPPAG
jgi:signal transduction histidine kinase